jgi:ureidoacrylate peracid hydrolase
MKLGFEIIPQETALLVIDMQNGFCHDTGSMAKSGANTQPVKDIIPNVKRLVGLCREAQIRVLWSRQLHFPDDITRLRHKIPTHIDKIEALPCVKGTWDAEIVDELKSDILSEDDIIEKHRSSCFYNTRLEVVLRMRGVNMLIISGTTTYYCVDSTIRDAYARDFDIIVVEDCVAASDQELHRATLKIAGLFHGAVVSLEVLSKQLLKE